MRFSPLRNPAWLVLPLLVTGCEDDCTRRAYFDADEDGRGDPASPTTIHVCDHVPAGVALYGDDEEPLCYSNDTELCGKCGVRPAAYYVDEDRDGRPDEPRREVLACEPRPGLLEKPADAPMSTCETDPSAAGCAPRGCGDGIIDADEQCDDDAQRAAGTCVACKKSSGWRVVLPSSEGRGELCSVDDSQYYVATSDKLHRVSSLGVAWTSETSLHNLGCSSDEVRGYRAIGTELTMERWADRGGLLSTITVVEDLGGPLAAPTLLTVNKRWGTFLAYQAQDGDAPGPITLQRIDTEGLPLGEPVVFAQTLGGERLRALESSGGEPLGHDYWSPSSIRALALGEGGAVLIEGEIGPSGLPSGGRAVRAAPSVAADEVRGAVLVTGGALIALTSGAESAAKSRLVTVTAATAADYGGFDVALERGKSESIQAITWRDRDLVVASTIDGELALTLREAVPRTIMTGLRDTNVDDMAMRSGEQVVVLTRGKERTLQLFDFSELAPRELPRSIGDACTAGAECATTMCRDGRCDWATGPEGYGCNANSMCWSKMCVDGKCTASDGLAQGESCRWAEECASKRCASGTCG